MGTTITWCLVVLVVAPCEKKIPAGLQDELHREAVQREEALKRLETKLREAQLHSAAW